MGGGSRTAYPAPRAVAAFAADVDAAEIALLIVFKVRFQKGLSANFDDDFELTPSRSFLQACEAVGLTRPLIPS